MITEMTTRKYTLRERAARQEETRSRIVEATMALHEDLGPRYTTVSAIAERAGVQRLTVYRHFPDDHALFEACSSTWLARHPPPDPASWSGTDEAAARCRQALSMMYGYYRQTAGMWDVAYRDVGVVEALQGPMAGVDEYLDNVRDDLVRAWHARGGRRKQLSSAASLALHFRTWQHLDQQGMSDNGMAGLMAGWLECIGG